MRKRLHRASAAALLLMSAGAAWCGIAIVALPLTEHTTRQAPAGQLVAGAAVTLLVAATWLLILVAVELTAALGAPTPAHHRRMVPGQAAVAAVVAAALGSMAPANAAPERIPAPDRSPQPTATVLVRPGDTLWGIAEAQLHDGEGSPTAVLRSVARLHRNNASAIGPDPDHIQPGIRLRLPTPPREEDR